MVPTETRFLARHGSQGVGIGDQIPPSIPGEWLSFHIHNLDVINFTSTLDGINFIVQGFDDRVTASDQSIDRSVVYPVVVLNTLKDP
jgi:hypothetical protein